MPSLSSPSDPPTSFGPLTASQRTYRESSLPPYAATVLSPAHAPSPHSLIVPSSDALYSRPPATAGDLTPPSRPLRVASAAPVPASHARTVVSSDPLIAFPSHVASAVTDDACPSSVLWHTHLYPPAPTP